MIRITPGTTLRRLGPISKPTQQGRHWQPPSASLIREGGSYKTTSSRDNITPFLIGLGVPIPAGHILGCSRDTMLAGKVSEKVGSAVVGPD